MGATLLLPAPLRELAGGRAAVELPGEPRNLGEALEALRRAFPAVHERIVTERGELRPHVNAFVETEDVRHTGGLATPLQEASRIVILPSVSGGRPVRKRGPGAATPPRPGGRGGGQPNELCGGRQR